MLYKRTFVRSPMLAATIRAILNCHSPGSFADAPDDILLDSQTMGKIEVLSRPSFVIPKSSILLAIAPLDHPSFRSSSAQVALAARSSRSLVSVPSQASSRRFRQTEDTPRPAEARRASRCSGSCQRCRRSSLSRRRPASVFGPDFIPHSSPCFAFGLGM